MNKNEIFADKYRNAKKNGNSLPSFAKLLTKQNIDYDRVEGLLWADPQLISNLRCVIEEEKLAYEAPYGLHRDIQACKLRAVALICLALNDADFLKLSDKLSRRKKEYIKSVRTRFQNAKMSAAYA